MKNLHQIIQQRLSTRTIRVYETSILTTVCRLIWSKLTREYDYYNRLISLRQ